MTQGWNLAFRPLIGTGLLQFLKKKNFASAINLKKKLKAKSNTVNSWGIALFKTGSGWTLHWKQRPLVNLLLSTLLQHLCTINQSMKASSNSGCLHHSKLWPIKSKTAKLVCCKQPISTGILITWVPLSLAQLGFTVQCKPHFTMFKILKQSYFHFFKMYVNSNWVLPWYWHCYRVSFEQSILLLNTSWSKMTVFDCLAIPVSTWTSAILILPNCLQHQSALFSNKDTRLLVKVIALVIIRTKIQDLQLLVL